jgi:hypothetical protein
MSKRCRLCGSPIPSGQRYCDAKCRLLAVGRCEMVTKQDADEGWTKVIQGIRKLWRKD